MADAKGSSYLAERIEPPVDGKRVPRRATIAALGGLILIGAYAVAHATGGVWLGPALLLRWGVPCVAAGAAWLVLAARKRADRAFWGACAAALTLWAAGSVAAGFLPSNPALSSGAWLGACLGWLVALGCLFRAGPRSSDWTARVEGGLLIVCGATLAGYFLLEPLRAQEWMLWPLIQAGAGLLLFAAAVAVRYGVSGPLPRAHALALSGLLPMLVGAERELWSVATATPLPDGLDGALAIAAGLLFVAAAHAAVYVPRPAVPSLAWEHYAGWLPLTSLGGVILLPLFRPNSGRWTDTVGLGVLLCLTLGVVRLALSLGENRQLRQERQQLLWQNEEYARLAISDPLTELFNKGYYAYRLSAEWDRSARYAYPLTLIALDLDNFKGVNDHYGHAAGDALLVAIGQTLRAGCRSVDIPCRCGGDEFSIILPQTDPAAGLLLADRLRGAVAEVLKRQGLHPYVSVSAGVAGYPTTADNVTDLQAQADSALYAAKHAGKNRAVRWTPALATPTPGPRAAYDMRESYPSQ